MFPYLQKIRELEINIYYNKRGTFAKTPIGDTALQAKLNGSFVGCD